LLSDSKSVEWSSLIFSGERHQLELRILGPAPADVIERMCGGLEEAEFDIRGMIVADIVIADRPREAPDGSVTLVIEALTLADD
jgi:hypothetical protein